MNDNAPLCLIVLAGGQSRRMGQDKATMALDGIRLIDRVIAEHRHSADWIGLSAPRDHGTGLPNIADDPDCPGGPVGAIYSIAAQLPTLCPGADRFITIPVDAPFAPPELVQRLSAQPGCSVAESPDQIHPVFAQWLCATVNMVRGTHETHGHAPSLHWLARQCDATTVQWPDESAFMNVNRPEDLAAAEARIKKAGA